MSKSNRKIHAAAPATPVTKTPGATVPPPAPNGSPWQALIRYDPAKPNDPEMTLLNDQVQFEELLSALQQLRDAIIESRVRAVLNDQMQRQAEIEKTKPSLPSK